MLSLSKHLYRATKPPVISNKADARADCLITYDRGLNFQR